jgi:hypothetical protein
LVAKFFGLADFKNDGPLGLLRAAAAPSVGTAVFVLFSISSLLCFASASDRALPDRWLSDDEDDDVETSMLGVMDTAMG